MGKIVRAKWGKVVLMSAITTDMVEEARKIHNTNPPATAAVGRALTGLALYSMVFKDSAISRIVMQFMADGPIGEITVETNMKGHFRAYVKNPQPPYEIKGDKLPVGEIVGTGHLYVYKHLEEGIYQSVVPLISGEIAEDIAYFVYKSEQIPSAFALGVLVDEYGRVKAAGGLWAYLEPGATEEEIKLLEERFQHLGSVSKLVDAGLDNLALLNTISRSYTVVDEMDVEYRCWCSRESVEEALVSLAASEREKLLEEEKVEIRCRYCGKIYTFTRDEIKQLFLES